MLKLTDGEFFEEQYQIISCLGAGGMGQVYRALQLSLNREVAIKILSREGLADEEARQRFLREFKILSSLQDPRIMTVYNMSMTASSIPYAVCEYISGKSLRTLLQEESKLAWSQVLDIWMQVCQALKFAHEQGVIHRDIKPENIMLCAQGKESLVKLIDFGLSRAVDPANSNAQKLTKTGILIGSSHYMSPEQSKGESLSTKSDIYSLAVVIFELLSGEKLFDADTAIGILYQHSAGDPESRIQSLGSALPPRAAKILRVCLSKRADDRYDSERLLKALESLNASSDPYADAKDSRAQVQDNAAKSKWKTAAFVAFIAVLVLSASLFALNLKSNQSTSKISACPTKTTNKKELALLTEVKALEKKRELPARNRMLLEAYCKLGNYYLTDKRHSNAIEFQSKAIALTEKMAGPKHKSLVPILVKMSGSYFELGMVKEAKAAIERCIEVQLNQPLRIDGEIVEIVSLVEFLYNHQMSKQAIEFTKAVLKKSESSDSLNLPTLISLKLELARAYFYDGDYAKAEKLSRALIHELTEQNNKVFDYQAQQALQAQLLLAGICKKTGQLKESEAILKKIADKELNSSKAPRAPGSAVELVRKAVLPGETSHDRFIPERIEALTDLAKFYTNQKRFHEAESYLLRLVTSIKDSAPMSQQPLLVNPTAQLAEVYSMHGKKTESENLLASMVTHVKKTNPKDADSIYTLMTAHASMLAEHGKYDSFAKESEELHRFATSNFGKNSSQASSALKIVGDSYLARKQFKAAEKLYRSALETERNQDLCLHGRERLYCALSAQGKFKEALIEIERFRNLCKSRYGVDSRFYAEGLINSARIHIEMKELEKAKVLLEEADGIMRKREKGIDPLDYQTRFEIFKLLGRVCARLGDSNGLNVSSQNAIDLSKKSKAISAEGFTEFLLCSAQDMNQTGNYDKSAKLQSLALKYCHSNEAICKKFQARTLYGLANTFRLKEDLKKAKSFAERVYKLVSNDFGSDKTLWAGVAHEFRHICVMGYYYKDAESVCKALAEFEKKNHSETSTEYITELITLANIYRGMENTSLAFAKYKSALQLYDKYSRKKDSLYTDCLAYEADMLLRAGELEKSEKLLEKCEGWLRLYFVSRLRQKQGRYAEAEKLLKEVIKIKKQELNPPNYISLEIIDSLCEALNKQSKFQETESLLDEKVKQAEKLSGSRSILMARLNLYRGKLRYMQNDFKNAMQYFLKSQSMTAEFLGEKQMDMPYLQMAKSFRKEKNYREAEKNYKKALEVIRTNFSSSSPTEAECLDDYASFLAETGKNAEAGKLSQSSKTIKERLKAMASAI